jgi:hypothetical protein
MTDDISEPSMSKQIEYLKNEREALLKFADSLKISDSEVQNIDPALLHYQKSDKLVQTPVPEPLAVITEDENGTISQLEILEKIFTIEIPVDENGHFDPTSKKMKKFGGLPGTMAGVDKYINLTPAIEGERAELYAQSIKPAQPTVPQFMEQKEQEKSFFGKVSDFFGGLFNRGSKN